MAYPIQVNFDDRSASAKRPIGLPYGATVIVSDRGPTEPILISPKQSKRIIDICGVPDTGKEGIWDVIEFNNSYPIWLSAPSTGGAYGGVLVKKTGTVPFVSGKASKELDFEAILNKESAGTGNGIITNFTKTINTPLEYVPNSIDILVNGVSIALLSSNADVEILTTNPDIGSGTFTRATGVLDFTFDNPVVLGQTVEVTYESNASTTAYFAVFNKNPQADDLKLKVAKSSIAGQYSLSLQKLDYVTNTYKIVAGWPKTISTIPNTKNGNGVNIYGPVLLAEDDFVSVVVNTDLAFSTFTDDTTFVSFAGGIRGATGDPAIASGWAYFQSKNKYKATIFFDTTADSSVPPIFQTLRASYQKRADYLLPTINDTATAINVAVDALSIDNRGIKFFATGFGEVINNYTGSPITSSLMGRVALRYADIANDAFRGLAPSWYNTNGKWGGQLGGGITKLIHEWNDTEQDALKANKVNPVIFDNSFGVVIVSQLTSQSLESDYAYQAHSGLADNIVQTVEENILPFQLSKPNDDFHRTSIKSQIETILRLMSQVGSNQLLSYYSVICDGENNNSDVLSRREFVVDVIVRFTPTSELIVLNFINDAQGTTTVTGA